MSQAADDLLELVSGRRGHFQLESGHHGELWLDLDALFAQPARIAPFIARLATALRRHEVAGVCGPLVGGAFLAQSVAGALEVEFSFTERVPSPSDTGLYQARYRLLLLGSAGLDFFLQNGVAVGAVARLPFNVWAPSACPLCADGVPLERPSELEEGTDPAP